MNQLELNEKFRKVLCAFAKENNLKLNDKQLIKVLRNWYESLNIMRLGLEKQNVKLDVVEEILRPENKRFVFNPVRICA